MSGTTDITKDLTKRISPKLQDGLLLINSETKAVQELKIDDIRNLFAAFFTGAIIPQNINAGTVLGTPAEVQIYYAPAGSYTTPTGVVNLTGNLNMWFWNKVTWSYMEVPVSVDATPLAKIADIINNLTSGGSAKMLSAEQGKVLNQLIADFVNDVVINSFSTNSKNLFNYADPNVLRGFYILGDGSVGTIQPNSTYSVTGYIPIKAGQTLIANKANAIAAIGHNLYDINKVRLSTVNLTKQVTATVDGYARFTMNVTAAENISIANVQIENGIVSTAYVPYGRNLKGDVIIADTVDLSKLSPSIRATLVAANTAYVKALKNESDISLFSAATKNLFNYQDPGIERGKYIAGDGGNVGNLLPNATYSVTGYIPIKAGQTIRSNKSPNGTAFGVNLYDSNYIKLSTTNATVNITAGVDGYARFTILVTAAENIAIANVQIENGIVSTTVVPYGRNIDAGKLIDGSVTKAKLTTDMQGVFASFVEKIAYDGLINKVVITGGKSANSSLDISGWGGEYNKVNVDFNGIRIPSGTIYNPSVADLRKWKYIQVCIKNAKADTTFIAKSPLVDIGGLTVLPSLIMPLMSPDLNDFVTLNDASFTGGSYWVNVYYYNSDMSYAYGGNIVGTMPNYVAGSSCYTTTQATPASWATYTGSPSLAFEHVLLSNVKKFQHLIELDALQAAVNSMVQEVVEVILPDKIYAIVGDTLQLFYRGIIKAVNPYNYDILINCTKGAWFPRYFEYTPVMGDVGTVTFTIKVKNSSGTVIATKTCSLVTRNAVASPSTLKKVLTIGDSLTNARIYPVEAYRRLTGTGGSPAGKAFTNISFNGRKKAGVVGVEGNSGWSWSDYLTVGRKAFTFTVTAPTIMPTVEAVYNDANGKAFTMWWDYSTTSLKFLVNDNSSTPPAAGVLTKVSGTGDATITFSARVQSSGNPFWNDGTGALDITSYVNKWCGGSIDIVYVLLTWNAQYGNRTDFTAFTNYAKTFFDHIKASYPSIKIKLMGVQVSDLRGGVRVDGSPQENTYTDTYGLAVTALNMNKAYQDLANDVAYSGFLEFIHVSSQVDSEYNMPYLPKAVNTRNTTATEPIGTNDVHPNTDGYNQIGDVYYRNFVANFCQ